MGWATTGWLASRADPSCRPGCLLHCLLQMKPSARSRYFDVIPLSKDWTKTAWSGTGLEVAFSDGILACSQLDSWCLCTAPSFSKAEQGEVVHWAMAGSPRRSALVTGRQSCPSWQVGKSVSTLQIRKQQWSNKSSPYWQQLSSSQSALT